MFIYAYWAFSLKLMLNSKWIWENFFDLDGLSPRCDTRWKHPDQRPTRSSPSITDVTSTHKRNSTRNRQQTLNRNLITSRPLICRLNQCRVTIILFADISPAACNYNYEKKPRRDINVDDLQWSTLIRPAQRKKNHCYPAPATRYGWISHSLPSLPEARAEFKQLGTWQCWKYQNFWACEVKCK